MNDLLAAFVDAVNSELLRQMCENGEDVPYSREALDLSIQRCLEEMASLEQCGQSFDHLAYSEDVLRTIRETSDSDVIMEAFREYCHFESMLIIFSEFPELRARLRNAGLGSWTKLRVDNRTLLPFARQLIDRVGGALARGGVLPPGTEVETAEFLFQVSNIFDIPLSPEFQARIEWYLSLPMVMGCSGEERNGSGVLN